MLSYGGAIAV